MFWAISLIVSYFRLYSGILLGQKSNSYSRSKSQFFASTSAGAQRPICIVTGATSGLGAAVAHALSREGFFVVLVGRSNHLLSKTMLEIIKEDENAQLKAFEVDLSSFSSVLKFKASFEQWLVNMNMDPSVQLLINNAGVLAKEYRSTPDGLDEMIATNYVGPFCLTNLLLPLLMNSRVPARVVNVTSFTHRSVNNMQVDKEFLTGTPFSKLPSYPFAHIYEYSKLCLLLFTYELHRQFSLREETRHISVIAADPGVVKTNIMREIPSCASQLAFVALKLLGLLQYPEDGIGSILDAALAPPETSGVYFFGGKGNTISSSALSYDSKLAEKLWKSSSDLLLDLKLYSNKISPESHSQ